MTNEDPLFFWRLQDELRVPDAAILMLGEDPSRKEEQWDETMQEGYLSQTRNYDGFEAAFRAIQSAILRGEVRATMVYNFNPVGLLDPKDGNHVSVREADLIAFLKSNGLQTERTGDPDAWVDISKEPDWDQTMVDVESIRRWLRKKAVVDGFFVPKTEEENTASYADPAHEHFSAELDLAVKVWVALASQQRFHRSPKASIDSWIEDHPEAWRGDDLLSSKAKERISTLVNWKKSGGAPSSGT